jgi:hypothetical protein
VRTVPATLVAFLLLLTLSATTPTGTGDGVHGSVLLHPLFTHTHLIDGRIVPHNGAAESASSTDGPAFGAAAGSATVASDAVVVSPTLPLHSLQLDPPRHDIFPHDRLLRPRGLTLPPPDPPPTLWA